MAARVVFVREVVPRRALAAIACMAYGERYVVRPMRHRVDAGRVEYGWDAGGGRWQSIAARVEGEPRVPASGSHEAFIRDHLFGYVLAPDGSAREYEVQHPP